MKKLLIFTLTIMLILPLAVACSNDSGDSGLFSTAESSISANVSSADVSKGDNSTESSEASAEESAETAEVPEFIANFISIGVVDTKVKATSSNSIQLTGIDTEPTYGAVTLITDSAGILSQYTTADYAIAVFEYNTTLFGYTLKSFYDLGAEAVIERAEDGFVLAVHSHHKSYINKLKRLDNATTVFPHGLHLYTGSDYTVKKAEKPLNIDGNPDVSEWEAYYIETVNASNPSWSYAQFETNNYYATAKYYTAYDKDYLYLCVVVDSPYHYCPISSDKPNDMYQYECIQVKVSSQSPNGEYIAENFDHVSNNTAVGEGIVRSYGFAFNDNGETCYYENGISTTFTGLAGCYRSDEDQLTVYEVAIPFAEFGVTPESAMEMGLTFSINSTNEQDVQNGVWKNITYRNGGGVIGRNDWSKIPVITLE